MQSSQNIPRHTPNKSHPRQPEKPTSRKPPPGSSQTSSKQTSFKRSSPIARKSVSKQSTNVSKKQNEDPPVQLPPSFLKQLSVLDLELSNALQSYQRRFTQGTAAKTPQYAYFDAHPVDDFHERIPEMALKFPFELDDFQKRAILHIEQQNSVFVAAHTSAGKTAVAEYAIAFAAALGSKVIYTSPIKSLSNQKLRDFRTKFDDVGLVTGDVSINDTAQCIIMTTEILRSMLYKGSDIIRDVSYVVFDEIQYLNDEERGVVWEESIIMLPSHIGIIFLSATVPNALEFASWIGRTKKRRVAVVSTLTRPVPLEHSILFQNCATPDKLKKQVLLLQGGSFDEGSFRATMKTIGIFKDSKIREKKRKKGQKKNENEGGDILLSEQDPSETGACEEKAALIEDVSSKTAVQLTHKDRPSKGTNQNKGPSARIARMASSAAATANGRNDRPNSRQSPWTPLVRYLVAEDKTPAVVFCFSKMKCEAAVESLQGSDLLASKEDKNYIHNFVEKAILQLREEDRNLPQVLRMRENLKRGISAHHSGLLPLVKEVTEVMFGKGLVKVLFSTETFAMGVNMPARTVVFSSVRKFDGKKHRNLQPSEYIQMAGRAGRRQLDTVGHVMLFFAPNEKFPDAADMKFIMTGKPNSLKSAFRLTHNMILNVLRVDELRVEEVMKRSFSEALEGTKSENVSNILSKVGDTLLSIKGSDNASSKEKEETCGINSSDALLQDFIKTYCEIIELQRKLTFRDLNPIFQEYLSPGRLVIAELGSGHLALSTLFSIVPPSYRVRSKPTTSKCEEFVRADSKLWIAAIKSVKCAAIRQHMPSMLLLPESSFCKSRGSGEKKIPSVVTSDGLMVELTLIKASSIVYICSEKMTLSAGKELHQARAAKGWFYSDYSNALYKPLTTNAIYLQKMVREWRVRQKSNSSAECFPGEVSDASSSKVGNQKGKKVSGMNGNFSSAYMQRAKICREMVTSSDLFNSLMGATGDELMTRIGRLILENGIKKKISKLQAIQDVRSKPLLLPQYQKRVQFLQDLNYVGSDGASLQLKGRFACEVATVDCVILTEIVLDNVLQGLCPSELASLLSCLVCRKKSVADAWNNDEKKYREQYCIAKKQLGNIVQKVGDLQSQMGVELDCVEDGSTYESCMCRWDLADAVYAWALGEPFCNITKLTDQQEGDIVVCIKRLSELLRDTQDVAKGIGNVELSENLEKAIDCIRRDVIFNGSLYYSDEIDYY